MRTNPPRRRLAVVALVLGLLALGLRIDRGEHGYTDDEVAHLQAQGWIAEFQSPETASNPPLFRWLTQPAPTLEDRLRSGRRISAWSASLAVGVLVWTCGLLMARPWAAGLGALPLAALELSVQSTAEARSYGMLALGLAAFMAAVTKWHSAPDDRRWMLAVAAIGAMLPWLHYLTIPWLLVFSVWVAARDRALRRLPWLIAPAALLSLPLLWQIGHHAMPRPAAQDTAWRMVERVLSWDIRPHLLTGWEWSLAALALWTLPWWWRGAPLPSAARIHWRAAIAFVGVILLVNMAHVVRPPVVVMVWIFLGPLLSWSLVSLRRPRGRAGLAVVLTATLLWPPWQGVGASSQRAEGANRARDVAAWLRSVELGVGDVVVGPPHRYLPFALVLTEGARPSGSRWLPLCDGTSPRCVVWDGRRVFAADDPAAQAPWRIDLSQAPAAPPGCARWASAPAWVPLYACDDRAVRP